MLELSDGRKLPFIFPDALTHSEVSDTITRHVMMELDDFPTTVSAGFVTVHAQCHGRSETLDLESSESDGVTITYHDQLKGIDIDLMPPPVKETLLADWRKNNES